MQIDNITKISSEEQSYNCRKYCTNQLPILCPQPSIIIETPPYSHHIAPSNNNQCTTTASITHPNNPVPLAPTLNPNTRLVFPPESC